MFAVWEAHRQFYHGNFGRKRQISGELISKQIATAGFDKHEQIYALESAFAIFIGYLSQKWSTPSEPSFLSENDLLEQARFTRPWEAKLFMWPTTSQLVEQISNNTFHVLDSIAWTEDLFSSVFHDLFPNPTRHSLGSFHTSSTLAHAIAAVASRERSFNTFADPMCGAGNFAMAIISEQRIKHCKGPEVIQLYDVSPLAVLMAKANLRIFATRSPDVELSQINIALLDSLLAEPAMRNDIVRATALSRYRDFKSKDHELDNEAEETHERLISALFFSDSVSLSDCVLGNPPWVNWEYLSPGYRESIAGLWERYELFDLVGLQRAYSKEDIAGLATVISLDKFVAHRGFLTYVLPDSLVKAPLNGRGFRRFRIAGNESFQVQEAFDLRDESIFQGATNRSVVLKLRKNASTHFPIPWHVASLRSSPCPSLKISETTCAYPSDRHDARSPWVSHHKNVSEEDKLLQGIPAYRARTGVFTGGANGVYYLKIIGSQNHLLKVCNDTDRAKRVVEKVEAFLEPQFIFPFIRGRDVSLWCSQEQLAILVPHTAETKMAAVEPKYLKAHAPHTLRYLEQFKASLDQRKGFVTWEDPYRKSAYYAIQRIGTYTFARYKIVWKYISREFTSCVISPSKSKFLSGKCVIPQEKLILIPAESAEEAYFICGFLSSPIVTNFIERRMSSTQIGPGIINNLFVPRFNAEIELHQRIASVCLQGHEAAETTINRNALNPFRIELDRLVSQLARKTDSNSSI